MKKKCSLVITPLLLSIALLAAALLITGCGGSSPIAPGKTSSSEDAAETAYHKITAEEAKEMLDADPTVILVDVRTQEEYEQSHIESAVLIPNETIKDTPPQELPDQQARIIVHCRTGVRSKQAADKLTALGYTQIYDMGGIVDWPYGTVSGP